MGLLDLFVAASMPVLKVLLVTALGSFLAIDRIDILGDDARKHLNRVVFFVFSPALISTNLARTITFESMLKLWFMPFNILVTFILGSALGWIVIQLTKAPRHLRGLILGCCAAGNLGNMLLIIIPAVCKEKGSPFGSPDVCHTYGMAYASLSMAHQLLRYCPNVEQNGATSFNKPASTIMTWCHPLHVCAAVLQQTLLLTLSLDLYGSIYGPQLGSVIGAIYLWSYVYNIVRVFSTISTKEVKINESTVSIKSSEEPSKTFPGSCTEPLLPSNDCLTSDSESSAYKYDLPCTTSSGRVKVPIYVKIKQHLRMLSGYLNLKTLFAPSTTGAIVGFIIGLVPLIRMSLIGDGAPLRVIQDSATLLGDGAIPSLTLIVGANLLKGLQGSGIHATLIVGIIVVRYIALPLLGIVVVKGALYFGLVHSDPLYLFILLIQFALPPAMNIGTITQLFGAGEKECSVIMLWTYALASVSLTL
ncbi:hypothetical protein HHK36_008845 [Tetracentron sinense]|uniref:PIN-like protein n=1 Tax=Tetracentron sinense TaxID=13715 RepID=A0A835DKC3_TETSI|nr:hypothetical protein HHK36_008845 [Tetracentron sinense]